MPHEIDVMWVLLVVPQLIVLAYLFGYWRGGQFVINKLKEK